VTGATADLQSLQQFIRGIPLFSGLNATDIEQLCRSSRSVTAKSGDMVIEEGAPGGTLYVILSGELEVTKRNGGQEIVLATRKRGDVIGEMSLLEQSPRTATARARQVTELLEIGPEAIRKLLESNPSAAMVLLRTIAIRLRSTEASLIQSDKLASLGTLAAGLAHELNNPAAAIQSSSAYLTEAFEKWRRRTIELQGSNLTVEQRQRLNELEQSVIDCGSPRGDDAQSSRDESQLIAALESLGVEDPWEIAPALVNFNWTVERIQQLSTSFKEGDHLSAVLQWLGSGLTAQQLIEEIRQSARAISDIVRAVKSYAYLDQAPVQNIDLRASLEDTLVILRHKLKDGVHVSRDFEAGLPRIEAHAGELNQVWTNIIDNAIQAMEGRGTLELRTRRLGDEVEVRIADSGPGIPTHVASRIFDPFFTTKAQGVGTGLGLHIAHNIVVNRHNGRIDFESAPGRTEFRISLPVQLKRN
jgi:signal transduction histidine kinase